MYRIAILASMLLTGCVTMDKLRTENCEDIINRSSAVDANYYTIPTPPGEVGICSTSKRSECCLFFVIQSGISYGDEDGSCYLGDSKYRYKTFCREII